MFRPSRDAGHLFVLGSTDLPLRPSFLYILRPVCASTGRPSDRVKAPPRLVEVGTEGGSGPGVSAADEEGGSLRMCRIDESPRSRLLSGGGGQKTRGSARNASQKTFGKKREPFEEGPSRGSRAEGLAKADGRPRRWRRDEVALVLARRCRESGRRELRLGFRSSDDVDSEPSGRSDKVGRSALRPKTGEAWFGRGDDPEGREEVLVFGS